MLCGVDSRRISAKRKYIVNSHSNIISFGDESSAQTQKAFIQLAQGRSTLDVVVFLFFLAYAFSRLILRLLLKCLAECGGFDARVLVAQPPKFRRYPSLRFVNGHRKERTPTDDSQLVLMSHRRRRTLEDFFGRGDDRPKYHSLPTKAVLVPFKR